jgi:hypothetical protein
MGRVLVVIIVVATVVVFPGCGNVPEEEPDPNPIEFREFHVYPRDAGTHWVFDGYFTIKEVNMRFPPKWKDLRVEVVTVEDSGLYPIVVTLIEPTELVRNDRGDTIEPGVYYYMKPYDKESERVEALAGIALVGMDLSFEGAEVHVLHKGDLLAHVGIPHAFPVPILHVTFSDVTVNAIEEDVGPLWEAIWTVVAIDPVDKQAPWELTNLHAAGADLFISRIPMAPDPEDGGPYNGSTHGTEVLGWYTSVNGTSYIEVGDVVRLTGMDERFMGAEIELLYNSTIVKTTHLPPTF